MGGFSGVRAQSQAIVLGLLLLLAGCGRNSGGSSASGTTDQTDVALAALFDPSTVDPKTARLAELHLSYVDPGCSDVDGAPPRVPDTFIPLEVSGVEDFVASASRTVDEWDPPMGVVSADCFNVMFQRVQFLQLALDDVRDAGETFTASPDFARAVEEVHRCLHERDANDLAGGTSVIDPSGFDTSVLRSWVSDSTRSRQVVEQCVADFVPVWKQHTDAEIERLTKASEPFREFRKALKSDASKSDAWFGEAPLAE
jgi:hypothetical protein